MKTIMGRSGTPLVVDGKIVRLPVKNADGEVRRNAVTSTGLLDVSGSKQ